jgi:predicted metalloprotease
MPEPAAAYLVAFSAMLFAGISALTLIHTVKHLDQPEVRPTPAHGYETVAA